MLEIHKLTHTADGKAAVAFIAHDKKAAKMLVTLFAAYIEVEEGVEVDLDIAADKFPVDVEVTAVYDNGRFGWTWKH